MIVENQNANENSAKGKSEIVWKRNERNFKI